MNISQMMQKSIIPTAPIYITGMGVKMTRIYDRLIHKYERNYPNIKLLPRARFLRSGQKVKGPAIILATSGMMLPQTFSYNLAQNFMDDPKNGIAFVGYVSPESPGYALREKSLEKINKAYKHIEN